MTNLVVNARFLTQPMTGVQRCAIEISRRLRSLERPVRFLAPHNIIHRELAEELGAEVVGRRKGHAWEQLDLSRAAGDDLLLNFCNNGPWFRRNQMVTIHDAAPAAIPDTFSWQFRALFGFATRQIGRMAHCILTDSHYSADQLAARFGIPRDKLEVVPLGHEHVFAHDSNHDVIANNRLSDRPFVLTVGSQSPHKNFAAIADAMQIIGDADFDLVIVGGATPQVHRASEVETPNSGKHIGYVTDAELRALYEQAAVYVHPSKYEGFGFPPLEAMALGCPVISSNAASLPEVGGDAVRYFDPNDPRELANHIISVVNDKGVQEDMRVKGLEQASRFRWNACVERILELADQHGRNQFKSK